MGAKPSPLLERALAGAYDPTEHVNMIPRELQNLPRPTFVWIDDSSINFEFCFGKQGASNSWRLLFSADVGLESGFLIETYHPDLKKPPVYYHGVAKALDRLYEIFGPKKETH